MRRSSERDPGRLARALQLAGWLHLSGRPGGAETWFRKVWEEGTGELRWEAGIGLAEALLYLGRTPESVHLEQELTREDLPVQLWVPARRTRAGQRGSRPARHPGPSLARARAPGGRAAEP